MHFQAEQIIENKGDGQIDRQAGHYQQQIPQVPGNQRHKEQKNQHRQPCAEINLVQLLLYMLRGVVADMHLISGRHLLLQFPHCLSHLLGQFQLVGGLLGRHIHIDGVQSVDTVIAGGCGFFMGHTDKLFQTYKCTVSRLQQDFFRMKLRLLACCCADKSYPLLVSGSLRQGTDSQKLLFIMPGYGRLYVGQGDAQAFQLHIIILQPPLHGCRSPQVHFIYSLQLPHHWFDVLLGIPLYKDGTGRSVQCIGDEGTRSPFVGTVGTDLRITHPLGQLRPCLAHNGRHFKPCRLHVRMLVQFQRDTSATVVRSGIDVLHSLHTGQHRFQPACHLCFNDTGSVARHGERNRQSGQGVRGRQLDRQLRQQRQAHQ